MTEKREVGKRIEELAAEIRRHNDLYYNEGSPEIADSEYDARVRELRALVEEHPDLAPREDPLVAVGAPLRRSKAFAQVSHRVPMLSLESLTSEEEIREFDQKAHRYLAVDVGDEAEAREPFEYSLEPKYDGVSASLLYEKGKLVRGLTRGDGSTGEEITKNLLAVQGVLPSFDAQKAPELVEIRGEVLIPRQRFEELAAEREAQGEIPFRNARNAVAGSLKRLKSEGLESLGMQFLFWGVGDLKGWQDLGSYSQLAERVAGLGFTISPLFTHGTGIEAVLAYHADLELRREELPYEMDGTVAKVDDFGLQHRLGRTAKAPRWALACKFKPRRATSQVLDIGLQVGRTGIVTPVAHLAPVEISGVTVQRATLHNFDLLAERDVRIGDSVIVERAGDVIPEVISVLISERPRDSRPFDVPETCPECHEDLEKEGAFLFCTNIDCPAQIQGRIVHLASRKALDIDRLGRKYVDQLFDAGLVKTVDDIFFLQDHREELLALDRWGEKSYENLVRELDRAREPELPRFLYGLGIRHVGRKVARDLAEAFGSFEALREADEEQLIEIEGVGPVVAREVVRFLESASNRTFLSRLEEAGVRPRSMEIRAGEALPLASQIFVFTGGLETMSRDQARERVESLGAATASGISKRVTTVVAGSKAGSKLDKARKLGLEILDEDGFRSLIEGLE